MGCRCAERMRRHVLPWFGYQQEGDVWVTKSPDVPKELRRIPDVEVARHHAVLTARIAFILGAARYRKWLASAVLVCVSFLALAACSNSTRPEVLRCVWTDTLYSTVGPWTMQTFHEGPKCVELLRDYPNKVRRLS